MSFNVNMGDGRFLLFSLLCKMHGFFWVSNKRPARSEEGRHEAAENQAIDSGLPLFA